MRENRETPLL